MKTAVAVLIFALALVTMPRTADAITLLLQPPTTSVSENGVFNVDLIVGGTEAGIAPSIGAFDLNIAYDATVLSATAVTFGSFLGDPDHEALSAFDLSTPGNVNVAQTSLLPADELDALQPNNFKLATISFIGLADAAQTSFQLVGDLRVDDAFGNKLPVPEPGTWATIAIGLLLIASLRRSIQ